MQMFIHGVNIAPFLGIGGFILLIFYIALRSAIWQDLNRDD